MATDRSDWPKKVEMAGQILVTQTANEERLSAPGLGGSQRVAFSAVGDNCELCASLDGKVFMADSDLARRYNPPLHPNCNCLWVEVGDDEPWAEADQDYMTTDYEAELAERELLDRGLWIGAPPGEGKYEVLRVPAAPRGRDFTFRRELDPKTGEMRSRLTWHRERYELPGLDARTIVDGVADVGERWRPLGGGGGASVPPVPPSGGPPAGPAPTAAARPVDGPITSLRGAEVERAIGEAVRAVEMPSPGAVVARVEASATTHIAVASEAPSSTRSAIGRKDNETSIRDARFEPAWLRLKQRDDDIAYAAHQLTGRPNRATSITDLTTAADRIGRASDDQLNAALDSQQRAMRRLRDADDQKTGRRERRRLVREADRRNAAVQRIRRERAARCLDELLLLTDSESATLRVDRSWLPWGSKAVDCGLDIFSRLVRKGSPVERMGLRFRPASPFTRRSSHRKGLIRIARGVDTAQVLHELGHALEISHPEIMSRTRRFLQARTVGQQPRRLSQDYPHLGYHDDEYYLPDLWFNDYCGKLYRGGATEILSMGLERLVREPIEFVREDPEYAGLILGIIEL